MFGYPWEATDEPESPREAFAGFPSPTNLRFDGYSTGVSMPLSSLGSYPAAGDVEGRLAPRAL